VLLSMLVPTLGRVQQLSYVLHAIYIYTRIIYSAKSRYGTTVRNYQATAQAQHRFAGLDLLLVCLASALVRPC
jgi:hypothetical protein